MKIKQNKMEYAISILLILFIILAIVSMSYFYRQVSAIDNRQEREHEYQFHYVMISDRPGEQQWQKIFEGGFEKGQELDAYVENWGVLLHQEYTVVEQMEMAIAANVDGIILNGYNSEEMIELINQAAEKQIPVVTLITDVPNSERISFISLNDYALGKLFGQQLLDLSQEKAAEGSGEKLSVSVLTESAQDIGISGVIYRGIFRAIGDFSESMNITSHEVGRDVEFEAEERIRDLLLGQGGRPDVLVSLNATNTVIAYQSLIDYNLVGQVRILGTSDNHQILDGIEKGIIYSTVFINEVRMGHRQWSY